MTSEGRPSGGLLRRHEAQCDADDEADGGGKHPVKAFGRERHGGEEVGEDRQLEARLAEARRDGGGACEGIVIG